MTGPFTSRRSRCETYLADESRPTVVKEGISFGQQAAQGFAVGPGIYLGRPHADVGRGVDLFLRTLAGAPSVAR